MARGWWDPVVRFVLAGGLSIYLMALVGLVALVAAALTVVGLRTGWARAGRTPFIVLCLCVGAAPLAGVVGGVHGAIRISDAVEEVNPADKATILAAGISESMYAVYVGSAEAGALGLLVFALTLLMARVGRRRGAAPVP